LRPRVPSIIPTSLETAVECVAFLDRFVFFGVLIFFFFFYFAGDFSFRDRSKSKNSRLMVMWSQLESLLATSLRWFSSTMARSQLLPLALKAQVTSFVSRFEWTRSPSLEEVRKVKHNLFSIVLWFAIFFSSLIET
jgi:hypothetical protein